MSIATHKTAAVVAALMLACASAAPAADFHPEDSACRLPCEVHDASAKAAPTAPAPTRVPPAASEMVRKRDKRTPIWRQQPTGAPMTAPQLHWLGNEYLADLLAEAPVFRA